MIAFTLNGTPQQFDVDAVMPLYSTDREILETALGWLKTGRRAVVTVARTWGSSPRSAGSLMLMRDDGVYNGSVSDDCVEENLIARHRDSLELI